MARLDFQGKTYTNAADIKMILAEYSVPYERWGTRTVAAEAADAQVLAAYKPEIDRLMSERGYVSVDLVALRPDTPNLSAITARFDKEHHHVDDEVRFTVEGAGVFEIEGAPGEFLRFTAEPGDLIVIPAKRRHAFYLTEKQTIRCIRLFLSKEGWEAVYDRAAE